MLAKSSFLLSVLALSISIGFVFYQTNQPSKLAYVDSAKLIQQYQGMQDAVKEYQGKAAIWQANVDTLARELEQMIQAYEQVKASLNTKEKQEKENLIRSKRQQLVEYQQVLSEKAQGEDAVMTKAVMEQINTYIKQYGKERGFQVIIGATQTGNLVYAEEGLDITEDILKGLNAEYQLARAK